MMLSNCGAREDSWESVALQGDPTSPSWRKSILNIYWKDWSWSSDTLATWWEELTHWKRPWCWERLKVGGEGDDRGWDGWMASLTQWTWVWVNSGSWWWTGRPGVLWSTGSQRVRHDWAVELNWRKFKSCITASLFYRCGIKNLERLDDLPKIIYLVRSRQGFSTQFSSLYQRGHSKSAVLLTHENNLHGLIYSPSPGLI